jgi:hypothetical protein
VETILVNLLVGYLVAAVPLLVPLRGLIASALTSLVRWAAQSLTEEQLLAALEWLKAHGVNPEEPESFIERVRASQGLPAEPAGEPTHDHSPGLIDRIREGHQP